ncbi:MAG TPA: hypothetical protein VJQ55_07710 [Candidatus Binatia bacterium]|nr:hypothetical protein [Candidatus Binatia bacterium]
MKPLFAVLLLAANISPGFAATKDSETPDREMLRMMEFLRQMEMIKQMDMLREMQHVDGGAAESKTPAPQTRAPEKKKETVK